MSKDIIDNALKTLTESPQSPPAKKRKITQDEIQENIPINEEDKINRIELSKILAKNPHIETSAIDVIQKEIDELSPDEVKRRLDQVKMKLNLNLPGHDAHGFLGALGYVLDNVLHMDGLGSTFVEDDQLSALTEYYFQDYFEWGSVPMKILYRLLEGIRKHKQKILPN